MALFSSSTTVIPPATDVPVQIAIVMDGNGRWAKKRMLPRVAGHKKGVDAVRRTVKACCELGVKHLTLFAFSSENWRRPPDEVSLLMKLFIHVLRRDVESMHRENIRLKIVGDLAEFDPTLQAAISSAEKLTQNNTGLCLNIAANYGGRWDILQATRKMLLEKPELCLSPNEICEEDLASYLCLSNSPEPDLFIRTGGEQRVSNFLLWQLAYTELYFTHRFWPEFGMEVLQEAIVSYNQRERRYGRTSEQLTPPSVIGVSCSS
jgi:undecaprenyl diphosphate synthase